mmetsp:Transcript_16759/g.47830  ORF Transcript_16759/g.47830 Transcript_16759/m.47830 type:complete len:263 (+) Transcript_16759:19-807(+)
MASHCPNPQPHASSSTSPPAASPPSRTASLPAFTPPSSNGASHSRKMPFNTSTSLGSRTMSSCPQSKLCNGAPAREASCWPCSKGMMLSRRPCSMATGMPPATPAMRSWDGMRWALMAALKQFRSARSSSRGGRRHRERTPTAASGTDRKGASKIRPRGGSAAAASSAGLPSSEGASGVHVSLTSLPLASTLPDGAAGAVAAGVPEQPSSRAMAPTAIPVPRLWPQTMTSLLLSGKASKAAKASRTADSSSGHTPSDWPNPA